MCTWHSDFIASGRFRVHLLYCTRTACNRLRRERPAAYLIASCELQLSIDVDDEIGEFDCLMDLRIAACRALLNTRGLTARPNLNSRFGRRPRAGAISFDLHIACASRGFLADKSVAYRMCQLHVSTRMWHSSRRWPSGNRSLGSFWCYCLGF